MRRIGNLTSEQQARTFQDYLLTHEIDTQVDQAADEWAVWVLDEDNLEEARRELSEFQADPQAERYATATDEARARRQARLQEGLDAKKRQVDMRERWERPVHQRIPITILLIVGCLGVTVATEFGGNREATNLVYIQHVDFASGTYNRLLPDVLSGEVWRLVTPIFLHGGFLHIGFNIYILFAFGGTIEEAKGKWRFLVMVLVIAIISNLAQFWGVLWQLAEWSQLFDDPGKFFSYGPTFGGMSGVNFGLIGYLWMKSRFAPDEGFYLPRYIVAQFLVWSVLCLFGLIGNIANTAHMVGLLAGMMIALTPVMYRFVRGR